MASIQERLADSLEVLKKYQDTHENLVINGQQELGTIHTKRLVQNGYLQPVIKGWYIPSFPGSEGDTTVWYASYWNSSWLMPTRDSEKTGVLLQKNRFRSMQEKLLLHASSSYEPQREATMSSVLCLEIP